MSQIFFKNENKKCRISSKVLQLIFMFEILDSGVSKQTLFVINLDQKQDCRLHSYTHTHRKLSLCVCFVLQFQVEEEGKEGFTKEVSMTWREVLDVEGEKCIDLRAGRKGSPPTCQQIILTHSSWHF